VKSYFSQGSEVYASAIRLELVPLFEFAPQITQLIEKESVVLSVVESEGGPLTVLLKGSNLFMVDLPFYA